MKKAKRLLTLVMCTSMLFTATACGGGNNVIDDGDEPAYGSVVEVQLYHPGGYGREFLDKLGEAFAETFKDKGYSINIVKAEKELNTENEILTPKKTTTDLYFSGGFSVLSAIEQSFGVLKTKDQVLLEDLTDSFYNSYAIGKDGKEESVKIIDKMNQEALQYTQYYGTKTQWRNKYYYMPWANSVTGFAVNADLLKNTFGLDIPVTTAEMIEQFEVIKEHEKDKPAESKIAPQVTAMDNAWGWWFYVTSVWHSQYSGAETWENFFKVVPPSGNIQEGYEIYNDDGIEYAYRTLLQMLRPENAPANSGGWDASTAAAAELSGKAVFFITGDWLANEMKKDFAEESAAMTMMKTPIVSELGVKLRLDGSTAGVDADEEKCEEVLRATVKLIDEGKSNAEIISEVSSSCGVTLTNDQIETLRTARGIYYNLGYNHQAIVPSFAKNRKLAVMFLRYMASDDGIDIFRKYALATLPFRSTKEIEGDLSELQRSCAAIADSEYAYSICEREDFSTLRSVAGLQRFNGSYSSIVLNSWNDAILTPEEKTGTVKEQAIKAAKKFRDDEYDWAKKNWASLLDMAGIF